MDNWITTFMDEFGYLGIFLLIAIENLFPPIPSEVILTFGGFMTTYTTLSIVGVIIASTLGSLFGAVALYLIGAWFEEKRMEKLITRYGRILRLTHEDIHKAYAWFHKYGPWAVFVCRLVPLVRSLISIPAGSVRMNFGTFLVLTTLGSLLWNTVLVYAGAAIGASWEEVLDYMSIYSSVVYAVIGLLAVLSVGLFMRKRIWQRK
ncbi:DedA family protein [Brevibacillus sp. TJ4]|uniref:DedA family protein n=1 Tax=Brevibacillus sp. TJ4 TaxID=3234853 RepID=UPI0037D74368